MTFPRASHDERYRRLNDLLAAGHRIHIRGPRGVNRGRAISLLREAISLADELHEPDAYIDGAGDLAGILMSNGRTSDSESSESIQVLTTAIGLARERENPALGALLTNLAECRMRANRDPQSLASARVELEEALPIRVNEIDRAYTLHNLGRLLFFIAEDHPDAAMKNLRISVEYFNSAIAIFRKSSQ